jgi:hypothetical protein
VYYVYMYIANIKPTQFRSPIPLSTLLDLDNNFFADGAKFHTTCANCEDCGCKITISNFTKSGTTLLCKTHYFQRFSVSGSYLGGDKFDKKSDRDTKAPSPSAGLFPEEAEETAAAVPATAAETPPPAVEAPAPVVVEAVVEPVVVTPPVAPTEQEEPVAAVEEPVAAVEEPVAAVEESVAAVEEAAPAEEVAVAPAAEAEPVIEEAAPAEEPAAPSTTEDETAEDAEDASV